MCATWRGGPIRWPRRRRRPPGAGREAHIERDLRALQAKQITIDVMILYTNRVMSRYIKDRRSSRHWPSSRPRDLRNSGIGNVSCGSRTSRWSTTMSRAASIQPSLRMVDGEGPFKAIHKLRNEKRADLVGMVLDDPPAAASPPRRRGADEAYFVVHHSAPHHHSRSRTRSATSSARGMTAASMPTTRRLPMARFRQRHEGARIRSYQQSARAACGFPSGRTRASNTTASPPARCQ